MGTNGGPPHRFVLRGIRGPERTEAIRADQNVISGKARAGPTSDSHHLWEVKAIRRFSNQIMEGLQEFTDV